MRSTHMWKGGNQTSRNTAKKTPACRTFSALLGKNPTSHMKNQTEMRHGGETKSASTKKQVGCTEEMIYPKKHENLDPKTTRKKTHKHTHEPEKCLHTKISNRGW